MPSPQGMLLGFDVWKVVSEISREMHLIVLHVQILERRVWVQQPETALQPFHQPNSIRNSTLPLEAKTDEVRKLVLMLSFFDASNIWSFAAD